MFKFIAALLIIFLFVFVFIVSIFGRIIRFFMPKSQQRARGQQQSQSRSKDNLTPIDTEKRFSDDIGEYTDYEEIKEE